MSHEKGLQMFGGKMGQDESTYIAQNGDYYGFIT